MSDRSKYPELRRRRFRPIPVRMLVPNFITLLAICAGLTAIRLSTEGRMELAVAAIVFAAILDGLDGRVARMIKGQSKFGAELDSLADFVNFGVAPGLILYFWQLHELNNGGWIAAMVFAISGGLRLARFNATIDDPNKPAFAANYFTGVPAPAGAITVLLPIYLAFLGVPMPPATLTAVYTLLIGVPDGVAAAGILRQDREDAGAAGNGAAGVRLGGVLHRAVDRLSLAHPVGRIGALSDEPAAGMEVLSRPRARRRGAGEGGDRAAVPADPPRTIRDLRPRCRPGRPAGPPELSGPPVHRICRNICHERSPSWVRCPISAIGAIAASRKKTAPNIRRNAVNKAVSAPLPASVLEALARYDTPTICNAMEIVAPERRLIGYTTKPLVCPFPDLPPMVGYARTVTIRSVLQSGLPAAEQAKRRIEYYEYVGTGFGPRITVIQDIDGADVGYGAFWGEVQSNVHKALGCLGVITDGSIRDIPQWAPGFQALAGSIGPSHAWVHAENFGGEVRVAGMTVRSDDLIHADQHGAIVIPIDIAAKIPDAAELCGRRETPILEIARAKDFSLEKLKEALKRSAEIH